MGSQKRVLQLARAVENALGPAKAVAACEALPAKAIMPMPETCLKPPQDRQHNMHAAELEACAEPMCKSINPYILMSWGGQLEPNRQELKFSQVIQSLQMGDAGSTAGGMQSDEPLTR